KRSMLDAAARVPFIVRYPNRFPANTRCRQPVSLVDLFPTFLAAAAVEETIPNDGVDLAPIVDGGATRPAVFAQHGEEQKGIYLIATRDWKYIYSAGEDREFLCDRVEDPQETRNKAGIRFCAPILEKLRQHLLEYLKQAGE